MSELRNGLLVATAVTATLLSQVAATWPLRGREVAVLALVAVTGAAAAFLRPTVVAAVTAGVSVFVVTGLLIGFSRAFFQKGPGVGGEADLQFAPLNAAEAVALVVLVVELVRKASPRVAAVGVAAVTLAALHAALVRRASAFSVGDDVLLVLLVGVAAVCVGVALRMRGQSRALLAAAAEERARRDERLDMARELHDVVAHHVTGMLVQAQAALVVAEQDKDRACAMLPGIVDGGTDALGAMRSMVRTLRDDSAAASAATATTDLTADLRALGEKSGLPVKMSIELPEIVRPELGRSVLRLVQEALTNVRKHARDATCVEVDVRLTANAVLLSIVDNGSARPSHSGGFGLVGMRERVHELGGRFFAGATGEGWLVTAELPLEVAA
ncbi:Signal transduction histidine kinase [Lentzea fradiae]|uniref:histidine kinase n=1 Tax=Lentzea fradiae TaxID=200378 RepID=A0A1G7QZC2_9PSEU|nr:histidine kinase [Lentzea fradiae]SDG03861.1 Signal transduction histidine kinase [Lentzea fradiae]